MKYLKKYNLIKESKDIVQRQFEFGDKVMELIIKDNPIVHDVDDVMNEINDILGHDVIPIYEVYIFHGNNITGFDIHQKEWWDYMGMGIGDYDDLEKDLKDAQKDLIKIRNGEYSDVKLQVNYQYPNASNNFESIQRDDKLEAAINQVKKHLTNIGCEVQDEGMSDTFWGIKVTTPIKISPSNDLDIITDGLSDDIITDFKQFISDYKIDDEGKIRLSNLIRKVK
jgi:hypothetical protein